MQLSSRWLLPVLASALMVGMTGCEARAPFDLVREGLSGPNLEYVPETKIKSAMWVLAAEVNRLEILLASREQRDEEATRDAVKASLMRMRAAARSLDEPGRTTQHPALNENLGRLLGRIERASRAVDHDPPNYFLASSLAGSCYFCHGRDADFVRLKEGRADVLARAGFADGPYTRPEPR